MIQAALDAGALRTGAGHCARMVPRPLDSARTGEIPEALSKDLLRREIGEDGPINAHGLMLAHLIDAFSPHGYGERS